MFCFGCIFSSMRATWPVVPCSGCRHVLFGVCFLKSILWYLHVMSMMYLRCFLCKACNCLTSFPYSVPSSGSHSRYYFYAHLTVRSDCVMWVFHKRLLSRPTVYDAMTTLSSSFLSNVSDWCMITWIITTCLINMLTKLKQLSLTMKYRCIGTNQLFRICVWLTFKLIPYWKYYDTTTNILLVRYLFFFF